MKHAVAFLALLLSISCAHTRYPKVLPSVAFFDRVETGRVVRCAGLDVSQCGAVAIAVGKINRAAGFPLLVMGKPASSWDTFIAKPTDRVTFVGTSALPPGGLGVTLPARPWLDARACPPDEGDQPGIGLVVVILSPQIWADAGITASVVLHEMFHAVGAGHADQHPSTASVERPNYRPDAPVDLSPGDVAALRAAYGS